jgi:peptide deformylase
MLEIRIYPDAVLKQKAETVKEITPEIKELILGMKETLAQEHEGVKGVGLAANQVGVLKRLIIVNFGQEMRAFINPEIIRKSRQQNPDKEGCLSLPGLWLKIKRANWVEIRARDENGRETRLRAEGLLARVFQHEIDHLDGILFYERLGFFERLRVKRKYGFG